MIGKSPDQNQHELFRSLLSDFIDMNHELILLAKEIDLLSIETGLSVYYSKAGQS